jgi:hypothetical protein
MVTSVRAPPSYGAVGVPCADTSVRAPPSYGAVGVPCADASRQRSPSRVKTCVYRLMVPNGLRPSIRAAVQANLASPA